MKKESPGRNERVTAGIKPPKLQIETGRRKR